MDPSHLSINSDLLDILDKDNIVASGLIKKFSNLSIAGMEVTQATQHYKSSAHLSDPNDYGPDNSIKLIAGKPAWVRVYLSSIFGISGITATLEIQRRSFGVVWSTVSTLNPAAPALTSVPSNISTDYATVRGSLAATLNFIIPSETMIGTLRLIARVSAGSISAEAKTVVAVTLQQTLRLAGVMIAYNGPASSAAGAPNLQLPAPTLADLQAMGATALTLFPVQAAAEFRSAGTITLTHHLQDTSFPTSGCGAGWNALHAQVANVRTADGNQPGWIYYGIFPTGVPLGPVGGCGGGGVAVGPVNQPGVLAHEAGHAAGLGHAPAGGAPNPDASYPAYEPYDPPGTPQASIGEYGLNINNGIIASPQTFRDFMAYGGPTWISPYHYGRLLNNASFTPATVGVDQAWWKDIFWEEYKKWPWIPIPDPPPLKLELPMFPPYYPKQKIISLIVRIERGSVAEVMHVTRTEVSGGLDDARATGLVALLRGRDGEVLAEAPLIRLTRQASGCGGCDGGKDDNAGNYLAQALLPDAGEGAALEIGDGETVQWQRKAPEKAIEVRDFSAELEETREGRPVIRVKWQLSEPARELWLRWSRGQEREEPGWRSLSTTLTGDTALIDPRLLPAGEVLLQLVAHDGFFSTPSRTARLRLPGRPPAVSILHPVEGHTYRAGQSLRLWGVATDSEDRPVTGRNLVWRLNERELGHGAELWIDLEPGDHTISLRAEAPGGAGTTAVRIVVERNEA
jgi:hypothetical protein